MLAQIVGFSAVISFILLVYFLNKQTEKFAGYQNNFDNGKSLPEKTLNDLKEKRMRNNPYHEKVGIGTGRCQFCGSKDIDKHMKPATPFMFIEKYHKKCHCCDRVIETY